MCSISSCIDHEGEDAIDVLIGDMAEHGSICHAGESYPFLLTDEALLREDTVQSRASGMDLCVVDIYVVDYFLGSRCAHADSLILQCCHELMPDIVHAGIDGLDGGGALSILASSFFRELPCRLESCFEMQLVECLVVRIEDKDADGQMCHAEREQEGCWNIGKMAEGADHDIVCDNEEDCQSGESQHAACVS